MKRLIGVVAATVVIFGSLCFSAPCAVARPAGAAGQVAVAAVDDPGVLAADRAFVQAFAKGDSAAAAKFLDTNFTWYETDGSSNSREASDRESEGWARACTGTRRCGSAREHLWST